MFCRRALKSLQDVSGVYGLVVACDEVQFPGYVVGHLTGGGTIASSAS